MHVVRRIADVPVIFQSVYGQDDAMARALDMGDDYYLVKLFSSTELAARTRAALRKWLESFAWEPSASCDVGGLSIDYTQRRSALAGEPVELTAHAHGC